MSHHSSVGGVQNKLILKRHKKLGFLLNESPWSSKQVQENFVRLVNLCSLWHYEVKVSHCVPHCAPNQIDYGKKNVEINSGTAIFSVFFLWQYNYTSEHHHLFLEWLWVLRILKKFVLDKNQKINVHIMSQILEKTFLTFSFAAVVLSSFDFCSKCITVQSWSRNPWKMELFVTIVKN